MIGRLLICLAVAGLVAVGIPATAQVELDRIVSRVAGRLITLSDIRQARTLRLVDETTSDEATQRALESRLLILHELSRGSAAPPPDREAVAARRAEWTASMGSDQAVPALLAQGGLSDGDLDAWFRDDVRIRAYLRRQFGRLDDAERTEAMREWLGRLRQRAELPQ